MFSASNAKRFSATLNRLRRLRTRSPYSINDVVSTLDRFPYKLFNPPGGSTLLCVRSVTARRASPRLAGVPVHSLCGVGAEYGDESGRRAPPERLAARLNAAWTSVSGGVRIGLSEGTWGECLGKAGWESWERGFLIRGCIMDLSGHIKVSLSDPLSVASGHLLKWYGDLFVWLSPRRLGFRDEMSRRQRSTVFPSASPPVLGRPLELGNVKNMPTPFHHRCGDDNSQGVSRQA